MFRFGIALMATAAFVASVSASASPNVDKFLKMEGDQTKCKAIEKGLDPIKSKNHDWTARALPADKVEWAEKQLAQIDYPTREQVSSIVGAIEEDPAKSFPHYLSVVGSDCVMTRYNLIKALISTALDKKTSADQRAKISESIRSTLEKPKYPTLMNASIDLALTELIVEKKVLIATDPQKKELSKWREDLKKVVREVNEIYLAKDKKSLNTAMEKESEKERAEALTKDPQYKKMAPTFIREVKVSDDYLNRSSKMVTELK